MLDNVQKKRGTSLHVSKVPSSHAPGSDVAGDCHENPERNRDYKDSAISKRRGLVAVHFSCMLRCVRRRRCLVEV